MSTHSFERTHLYTAKVATSGVHELKKMIQDRKFVPESAVFPDLELKSVLKMGHEICKSGLFVVASPVELHEAHKEYFTYKRDEYSVRREKGLPDITLVLEGTLKLPETETSAAVEQDILAHIDYKTFDSPRNPYRQHSDASSYVLGRLPSIA